MSKWLFLASSGFRHIEFDYSFGFVVTLCLHNIDATMLTMTLVKTKCFLTVCTCTSEYTYNFNTCVILILCYNKSDYMMVIKNGVALVMTVGFVALFICLIGLFLYGFDIVASVEEK